MTSLLEDQENKVRERGKKKNQEFSSDFWPKQMKCLVHVLILVIGNRDLVCYAKNKQSNFKNCDQMSEKRPLGGCFRGSLKSENTFFLQCLLKKGRKCIQYWIT